ncbi:MAG: hypothetical protein J7K23_01980 [Thermoproteales archaeon]|nr:hypothetical protein [Thermoproteales archaeon]
MSKLLQSRKFKSGPNKIARRVLKLEETINFAVVMGSNIDEALYREIMKRLDEIVMMLYSLNQELIEYEYECSKARFSGEEE